MTSTESVEDLCVWLDPIPFTRQKKNMPRDFADGVMMAELLKFFYPKTVELHNYSPASCFKHKINNWTTLNKKVFSKLGLKLHKEQIEQLASAAPHTILEILEVVKNTITLQKERKRSQTEQLPDNNQSFVCLVQQKAQTDSVIGIPVACENCDGQSFVVAMESMVPQRELDEKMAELAEKNEAINILVQKVSHLDTLLKLKDQRIKDLTQQLQLTKDKSKGITTTGLLTSQLITLKDGSHSTTL